MKLENRFLYTRLKYASCGQDEILVGTPLQSPQFLHEFNSFYTFLTVTSRDRHPMQFKPYLRAVMLA
jgi:hypothetical protein